MTTAQVCRMAGTENELLNLNHNKSRKLQYFGHEAAIWQRWRQCDGKSCRKCKKPWKTTNVLAGQHLSVDWPIGWYLLHALRDKVLDVTDIYAANRCEATTGKW